MFGRWLDRLLGVEHAQIPMREPEAVEIHRDAAGKLRFVPITPMARATMTRLLQDSLDAILNDARDVIDVLDPEEGGES